MNQNNLKGKPRRRLRVLPISIKIGKILLILLLISKGSLIYASSADLNNSETGENSENTNTADQNTNISFSITNTGDVENNIRTNLDTGNNTVTDNTKVGDIKTGDIAVKEDVANAINNKPEVINPAILNSDNLLVDSDNVLTGPDSINNNTINSNVEIAYNVSNVSNTTNEFALDLNTGNNTISNNTVVGDIITGNILAYITVSNYLNSIIPPVVPPVGPVVPPVGPIGPVGPGNNPVNPISSTELPNIEQILASNPPTEFASIPTEFFEAGKDLTYLLTILIAFLLALTIKQRRLGHRTT